MRILWALAACYTMVCLATEPLPGPLKKDEKESQGRAAGPARFRKKSGEDGESRRMDDKRVDDKRVDDNKPPAVAPRPIPGPETEAKTTSELDQDLLKEFGQNLEATEEEEDDPLLRAGRRMRDAEEKLARLDAAKATRELQEKALADLEELLKQAQNNNNQNQNQQQKKKSQKKKSSRQQQRQPQLSQAQKQQQQQNQSQQQDKQSAKKESKGRANRENMLSANERKDVWGHLGEMLRQELIQHAKEDYLPKYRQMLEDYYETIATQSQAR